MVVSAMLAFIVLALMAVFNSTQTAFRAGITQTGVQESGRATVDLIKTDLEGMTPSDSAAVNFYSAVTNYPSPSSPFFQSLVGSSSGQMRANVLENFFILSSANVNGRPSWVGTGYLVSTNSPDGTLYPLYRFSMTTNMMAADPLSLYTSFISTPFTNSPPWSHLMDGVADLTVRAFDANGRWITNDLSVTNAIFTNWVQVNPPYSFAPSEPSLFYMFSNVVPVSVEVELGVLEDRTLQRAESLPNVAPLWSQSNYLAGHAGQVHIFRQRAWIRNVDPSAYQ